MADIVDFKTKEKVPENAVQINPTAIELMEEALGKLRSGEYIAVALVCAHSDPAQTVSTFFDTGGKYYHQLTSGCAMLLTRISAP